MFELRANKAIKSCILCILLSLAIIKVTIFTSPLSEQRQSSTLKEFPVHTSSNPSAFISIWNTTRVSLGSSGSNQVRFPLELGGIYNFVADWGDGNNDTITIWNQTAVTHTYVSLGIYTINITGTIVGWRFNDGGDRLKLLEIQQWGCLQLLDSGSYFYGCSNLKLTALDALNLTGVTDLGECFKDCHNLGSIGDMNDWDVSSVISMYGMFSAASSFNQPISNWDVSSVTDMGSMFDLTVLFNQSIGNWNVSSAKSMWSMFSQAISFNQPIGEWDVSNVMFMSDMFYYASNFNQPIGEWNVSSVVDMDGMFSVASSFNQPIGEWDVSSVTSMYDMFYYASKFNQPIGDWNVSSVKEMNNMFYNVKLSTQNYDNLLLGWSQLSLQNGVIFNGGNSKYSNAAVNARQTLITNFGWTITDGGLEAPGIPGYNLMMFVAALGVIIVIVIFLKGTKKAKL